MMTRMIFLLAVLGLLFGLTGCTDPEPGEISIISTKNGRKQGCVVQVYSPSGILLNLVPTDQNGLVYIKKLTPGTYSLKFQDRDKNLYRAEKSVTVEPGETNVVRVELNEAPPTPEGGGGE